METETSKQWYQSKSVWGGIVAVAAGIAGFFGINLEPSAQTQLVDAFLALAGATGGMVAIIGRIKADRKIRQ